MTVATRHLYFFIRQSANKLKVLEKNGWATWQTCSTSCGGEKTVVFSSQAHMSSGPPADMPHTRLYIEDRHVLRTNCCIPYFHTRTPPSLFAHCVFYPTRGKVTPSPARVDITCQRTAQQCFTRHNSFTEFRLLARIPSLSSLYGSFSQLSTGMLTTAPIIGRRGSRQEPRPDCHSASRCRSPWPLNGTDSTASFDQSPRRRIATRDLMAPTVRPAFTSRSCQSCSNVRSLMLKLGPEALIGGA